MVDTLQVNRAEATCCARRAQLDGREHLVVPVIGLAPGVLNGELVPADEVAASVAQWNDVPVPIEHPRSRGVPISARQPEILEGTVAGRLYNASIGADGRLHGELWLDVAKAAKLGHAELLAQLEAGAPVEVSTAYFRDLDATPGTWTDGRPYRGIARNLRPDHLALLPHSKGACSWLDGCGAPRVNAAETGAMLALYLAPEQAGALAAYLSDLPADAELVAPDDMHVTLATWPNADPERRTETALAVAEVVRRFPQLIARIGGVARFLADEGGGRTALVALLDAPGLSDWRRTLLGWLPDAWQRPAMHDFLPHITLAYLPAGVAMPDVNLSALTLIFERLTLAWGAERVAFTLQGEASVTPNDLAAPAPDAARTAPAAVTDNGPATPATTAAGAEPALHMGGRTVEEERQAVDQVVAGAEPVEPAINAALLALNTAIEEFGGAAALREALSELRANRDAERQELVAELAANAQVGLSADELQGLSANVLRKLAGAFRPADYRGRGGPRQAEASDEWAVLAAPEVK